MAVGGASGSSGGTARGIEAGRAFVRLYVKDELSSQLKQIGERLNGIGTSLMKTGAALAAPLLAAIPLLRGAAGQLDELNQLDRVAKAFGTTGEGMSGLLGVLKAVGGPLKENIEGLTQFNQKVEEAASGKDGQGMELFEGLLVNAAKLNDLPIEEKFYRVHAAIRQLPQPMQMFKLSLMGGTDSMKQWLPLLSMSTDEVRRLAKTMEVSQTELTQANRATAALAMTTAVLGRAWDLVAVGVSPVIEKLAVELMKFLLPVKEWLIRNRELVGIIATVTLAVGALGGAVFLLGGAVKGTVLLAGLFKSSFAAAISPVVALTKATVMLGLSLYSFLITPLGVVAAALALLGVLFFTQTDLGKEWAAEIGGHFAQTAENAKAAYGGIVDAIRGGDLALAWDIVTTTLRLEWERLWAECKRLIREFWGFLWDGWDGTILLIKNAWIGLKQFVVEVSGKMVKESLEAVAMLAPAIGNALADLVQRANPELANILRVGGFVGGAAANQVAADAGAGAANAKVVADAERQAALAQFEAMQAIRKFVDDAAGAGDADKIAGLQAKLAELNAQAAAAAAKAGKANDEQKKRLDQLTQTAGLIVSQAGNFLGQALGPRSASPLEKKADRTNALLENILRAVQGGPGLVFQ